MHIKIGAKRYRVTEIIEEVTPVVMTTIDLTNDTSDDRNEKKSDMWTPRNAPICIPRERKKEETPISPTYEPISPVYEANPDSPDNPRSPSPYLPRSPPFAPSSPSYK